MTPSLQRISLRAFSNAALEHTALLTFVASLVLSSVALSTATLNRDGMLYVRTARAFLEGGLSAAADRFNWPFLSILMGSISHVTGLDPEIAGHILNATFMAGTCALMVACIMKVQPEDAVLAALIVLSIPGLNEYRGELLREYGCWFFLMLSFWSALLWAERPTWLGITWVQTALGLATLFRSEALTLYPALVLWQFFNAPKGERTARITMLCALPFTIALCVTAAFVSTELPTSRRLSTDIGRANLAQLDNKALALSSALIAYAHDNAKIILFFGSIALVPIKLVQKLGIFIVPLTYAMINGGWKPTISRFPLFAWVIGLHLLVLSIFVVDLQFLAGRYVGLTLLFSTPLLVSGARSLAEKGPRWQRLVVGAAVITMLANVTSLSRGKRHFVEAGEWLKENRTESAEVYIDSGRTAYFANWEEIRLESRSNRRLIEASVAAKRYKLYVLEVSKKDQPIYPWLHTTGLYVIQRFGEENEDSVVVARPVVDTEQKK